MIWAQPKQSGPDQNNFYLSKTIWIVQNHFGSIEDQDISEFGHLKTKWGIYFAFVSKSNLDWCVSLTIKTIIPGA